MQEFKSQDKFTLAGRGTVYVVSNPEKFLRGKCPWMNKDVLIDGQQFTVIGVEAMHTCFGTQCEDHDNVKIGATVGLLVK